MNHKGTKAQSPDSYRDHQVYFVLLRVFVPQPALTKEGWFKFNPDNYREYHYRKLGKCPG
jgi:hypothetical protein